MRVWYRHQKLAGEEVGVDFNKCLIYNKPMQERLLRTQSQIETIQSAAKSPIIPERKDLRSTGDVIRDNRREDFVALSSYPILPAFIHAA